MDKLNSDRYFLALGIAGAIVVMYGYTQVSPQKFYIIGSFLLLITALHFKLIYFIALECILLACYFSSLWGIGFHTQVSLPILLCLQLFIFYYMLDQHTNFLILIIGIIGIALLSLGFAFQNQWFYFFGSFSVATYSYFSALKKYPSYIWAGLNTYLAIFRLIHILLN